MLYLGMARLLSGLFFGSDIRDCSLCLYIIFVFIMFKNKQQFFTNQTSNKLLSIGHTISSLSFGVKCPFCHVTFYSTMHWPLTKHLTSTGKMSMHTWWDIPVRYHMLRRLAMTQVTPGTPQRERLDHRDGLVSLLSTQVLGKHKTIVQVIDRRIKNNEVKMGRNRIVISLVLL